MKYVVPVYVEVEAEDPDDARRIVRERARLKWPPVTEVLVGTPDPVPDYEGRPE